MKQFEELIKSEVPVLVDFYAQWCGPCKTMNPVLEQVKQEIGDAIRIEKVDVEEYPAESMNYSIRAIPTFILFVNGEQVWRHTGLSTADKLVEEITPYLNQVESTKS